MSGDARSETGRTRGRDEMLRYLIMAVMVVAGAVAAPRLAEEWLGAPAPLAQRAEAPTAPAGGAGEPARGPRTLVLALGRNGHYEVDAHFNGRPVRSLIDTGASVVALPAGVARASGVRPTAADFTVPVNTANGTVRAARATLRELRLGSIRLVNVEALVLPEGALQVPLIGMSALNRLAKVDIRSGTMRLIQ